MKIVLAHVDHSPGVADWYRSIAAAAGDVARVTPFCITLDAPGPRLHWRELDRMWRRKDRRLMNMYERLQTEALNADVLLVYNGANVHPELLAHLPTFNVFGCFDDPESSPGLSKPVAPAFDAVFYGNIASRFQYESWGCRKAAWLPVFTAPGDVPAFEDAQALLANERNVDIALVCEKNSHREQRLESLVAAFPQARCHGRGWPAGGVSGAELDQLYRSAKIGWNVHNSTGPINRRLFALAAYGVLPICDNKTGLGHIFELGKEAVGFDTVPEAIELTRYYLEHDDERRQIAANAHARFWRDYSAPAIWQRMVDQFQAWGAQRRDEHVPVVPRRGLADITRDAQAVLTRNAVRVQKIASTVRRKLQPQPPRPTPPLDERVYLGQRLTPYHENPEMMGVNMAARRLASDQPLDWPNILALNWAVTTLVGPAKRIVEIGAGTGPFAEFASVDPSRQLDCFEDDDFAREQAARRTQGRSNVNIQKDYNRLLRPPYDLLVSIEVIEHVRDLGSFLEFCRGLSPRAIFSTPNRLVLRGHDDQGPPPYAPHVREFSPGELYWLLKQHYNQVYLYHMPDVHVPWLEPLTLATQGTPIIAECLEPAVAQKQAA